MTDFGFDKFRSLSDLPGERQSNKGVPRYKTLITSLTNNLFKEFDNMCDYLSLISSKFGERKILNIVTRRGKYTYASDEASIIEDLISSFLWCCLSVDDEFSKVWRKSNSLCFPAGKYLTNYSGASTKERHCICNSIRYTTTLDLSEIRYDFYIIGEKLMIGEPVEIHRTKVDEAIEKIKALKKKIEGFAAENY